MPLQSSISKMGREVEAINISKAATTTNLFYLFFHGGKAAVIPFLTLFFRLIGLSALEAGGLIAAKTITGLIWAPLWARCATAYSRHRLVLTFSLFMMMVTYLSFPALYTQLAKPEHCWKVSDNGTVSMTPPMEQVGSAVTPAPSFAPPTTTPPTTAAEQTHSTSPPTAAPPELQTQTPAPTEKNEEPDDQESSETPPLETEVEETATIPSAAGVTPGEEIKSVPPSSSSEEFSEDFLDQTRALLKRMNLTPEDLVNMHDLGLTPEQLKGLSEILQKEEGGSSLPQMRKRSVSARREVHHLVKRAWTVEDVKEKLRSIQSTLQKDRVLLFLVLLAILVGGEIFASPVEKVADDSWFDFLNRIDDLERYGQQRFWGSIAFVLIPIVVTVAVDHTPCFLPYHIHHYLIHFYIFAVLLAAALIVSCWYPVPPPANGKYNSKICKGLRIICCDGRGFLFTLTLLITGMVYAASHNFLFWRIQNLGGSETTMGLCVAIGSFAEIPMLLFSGKFVKKLGNCWAVSLSLMILTLRVLYYAYVPNAWAILPVELAHGITHTALWFAILSYDDFNIGAAIDRSLRSILSSFYFGFGFSVGSIVAGYVFDTYGDSALFLGCSVVTGGWCILFSVVQKCLPKKEKVRYIKLLRSDSDNSEDEDDDWLEMALKDH
ncbi:major facilitator superfamily domain-containing protein 6-like protein A [Aplysia californica]|uniref:Major facilitator superfamily domain-containing protein 6-like protein A n=1 Tax=Aplysia californica TaxID=6500 RepID=A0ABM0JRI3_APLCA|nr:major facilitator superfamily domain-containing protein 6-like protein A [Aplysia californica]XP_035826042.1 major facilitator superfamily domain-containing protein 6-like protein A [Aplysia californica]